MAGRLRKIRLIGFPGRTFVDHPLLANVYIVTVSRNGMGYDRVYTTPGYRQCIHDPASGRITFETADPFKSSMPAPDDPPWWNRFLETVNITYR